MSHDTNITSQSVRVGLADADRAKRVKLYRNGDPSFYGKDFVINKRRVRTWDSFLQSVTSDLKTSVAVRSIRTPNHGTQVKSLDELEDHRQYVAVANGRFKPIRYSELEKDDIKMKHSSPRNSEQILSHVPSAVNGTELSVVKPVIHSKRYQVVPGRYNNVPTDAVTFYVFANGKELQQPRRITLTHQLIEQLDWTMLLSIITARVDLDSGACHKVYTMNGYQVTSINQFKNGDHYIAVGKEIGGLKKLNYGQHLRPDFKLSPRMSKRYTASLDSRSFTHTHKSRGSRTSTKTDPLTPSPTQKNRKQRNIQTSVGSGKQDEDIFHAKARQHKRSGDGTPTKQTDYDKDDSGVFRSRNRQKDTAETVEETKDTKVDLPIDQQEAQEVLDEEIEGELVVTQKVSKARKITSDVIQAVEQDLSPPASRQRSPEPKRLSPQPVISKTSKDILSPGKSGGKSVNGKSSKQAPNPDVDEQHAATKIQANFRGYKTRKDLKESRSMAPANHIKTPVKKTSQIKASSDRITTSEPSVKSSATKSAEQLGGQFMKQQTSTTKHTTSESQVSNSKKSSSKQLEADAQNVERSNSSSTKRQPSGRDTANVRKSTSKQHEVNAQDIDRPVSSASKELDEQKTELSSEAKQQTSGSSRHRSATTNAKKVSSQQVDSDEQHSKSSQKSLMNDVRLVMEKPGSNFQHTSIVTSDDYAKIYAEGDLKYGHAATKIQANYRGYKTRQELKNKLNVPAEQESAPITLRTSTAPEENQESPQLSRQQSASPKPISARDKLSPIASPQPMASPKHEASPRGDASPKREPSPKRGASPRGIFHPEASPQPGPVRETSASPNPEIVETQSRQQETNQTSTLSEEQRTAAAVKIQAAFRGYMVRRAMTNSREE